jgi:hypothetical protein
MNTPDLTTVAAGQMRDEMKRRIEIMIHQPPSLTVRLKIAEAAEWLRAGAPGRALEMLEELLTEFEREDFEPRKPGEPPPF